MFACSDQRCFPDYRWYLQTHTWCIISFHHVSERRPRWRNGTEWQGSRCQWEDSRSRLRKTDNPPLPALFSFLSSSFVAIINPSTVPPPSCLKLFSLLPVLLITFLYFHICPHSVSSLNLHTSSLVPLLFLPEIPPTPQFMTHRCTHPSLSCVKLLRYRWIISSLETSNLFIHLSTTLSITNLPTTWFTTLLDLLKPPSSFFQQWARNHKERFVCQLS